MILENFFSLVVFPVNGGHGPPLYINYKGPINKLTDDLKSIKLTISGETEAGSAGEQPAEG